MGVDEGADICLKQGCGAVDPAPELALGQKGEEALNRVDPECAEASPRGDGLIQDGDRGRFATDGLRCVGRLA